MTLVVSISGLSCKGLLSFISRLVIVMVCSCVVIVMVLLYQCGAVRQLSARVH